MQGGRRKCVSTQGCKVASTQGCNSLIVAQPTAVVRRRRRCWVLVASYYCGTAVLTVVQRFGSARTNAERRHEGSLAARPFARFRNFFFRVHLIVVVSSDRKGATKGTGAAGRIRG